MSKQTEYNRKWQEKNKERNLYLNLRSKTRSFIKNKATLGDLEELKALIYDRETHLKKEKEMLQMKSYVLIIDGMMEEYTYGDVQEAKNEIFRILKEQIYKRREISSFAICEVPNESEEQLAANGGQAGDLIDILSYDAVTEEIKNMMSSYDSVGLIATAGGALVYGKEHNETGENKDVYFIERDGVLVIEE